MSNHVGIGRETVLLTSLLREEADPERLIGGKADATFARLRVTRPEIARKADATDDHPALDLIPATEDTGAEGTEATPMIEGVEITRATGEEVVVVGTEGALRMTEDLETLMMTEIEDPTIEREAVGTETGKEIDLALRATIEDLKAAEILEETLTETETDLKEESLTGDLLSPDLTIDQTESLLKEEEAGLTPSLILIMRNPTTARVKMPTQRANQMKTEVAMTTTNTKMSD